MFENILSKLNSESKEFVGISLNSSGTLEVIQTSRVDGMVKKYINRFVNYNAITREIENYDELKLAIESAFDDLNISKNSNVTISLPNVLFGIASYPDMLQNEDVTNALTSEVEESYIFKREDPVISWSKIDIDGEGQQKVAYSAIQDSAVRELKTIFQEIGSNLISIQNNTSTLLKGLEFGECLDEFTKDKQPWNIVLISATSYSILNFTGDKLNAYYEEPLAVKSFNDEEVYVAVGSMAAAAMSNYPSQKSVIISDTDEISAQIMAQQLGASAFVEQNKYQQKPPVEIDLNILPGLIPQISLTAVGASVDHFEDKFIKFNYLAVKEGVSKLDSGDLLTIGDYSIELTKDKVTKIAGIFCAIAAVIFGIFYFIFSSTVAKEESQLQELQAEEAKLQEELKNNNAQPAGANIATTIDNIVKSNRKKMLYYDALSYGIPEKLWITYFYAGDGNAIAIDGIAADSSDIASFLKGIREVAGESEVSVSKLQINGDDDILGLNSGGPELYSFELSNQAYKTVLEAKQNPENAQNASNQPQQNQPVQNQQSQQQQPPANNNIPPANMPSTQPPLIKG